MALSSMTGFGQAEVELGTVRIRAELRTVNHRFAEFSIKLPRDLLALEDHIRTYLAGRIARGRTDLYLSVDATDSSAKEVAVDWDLFDRLCQIEREGRARAGVTAEPGADLLAIWLQHPDVVRVQSASLDPETLEGPITEAVALACDALTAMRLREGQRLERDLLAKLDDLQHVLDRMAGQAVAAVARQRDRLHARLRELLKEVDEQRLLMEAAVLAEKIGVDEELVRLNSHVHEFRSSLLAGSPIGRRLDFIVQEMHREVNTIGSKSVDVEISKAVVDAKTIVEQLREQIQNIE